MATFPLVEMCGLRQVAFINLCFLKSGMALRQPFPCGADDSWLFLYQMLCKVPYVTLSRNTASV
jgi:hypothetical protein